MIKDIIQTFLPWLIYFVLSGHTLEQMKIAIVASAIVSLLFERNGLKKKFILSWVTLLFFIFMFVAVVILNSSWVITHAWVLSNSALAFIAWFSILIKRPFTLQYAKEKVSADKWDHPIFWRINYLLTMTWGVIFLIGVLANILRLYYKNINPWVYELCTNGAVVFGIWFSVWFPSWYAGKKR